MAINDNSKLSYYFDQLSGLEQSYYQKVLRTLEQCGATVGPGIMIQDKGFERVLRAVSYDHPELFYVDFQRLGYMKTPFGVVYNPSYTYKSSTQSIMCDQINNAVQSILKEARTAGVRTSLEYCRWFHNYLVKNVKYNYDALRNPDMYPDAFNCFGALVNKKAVCEGISKAFKLLCDRAGVKAFVVAGESNLPSTNQMMAHAWNCIVVNNQYAHVDVTWDINMSEVAKSTRYDYFCMSDKDISVDHVFSGYPACTGDKLSYFCQTGKMFSNVQSLKTYLETEIRKKAPILYFKVMSDSNSPRDLHDKIQSLVQKMLSQHSVSSYSYQMVHNLKHNIFYYKLLW